jgi:hypothetical protein
LQDSLSLLMMYWYWELLVAPMMLENEQSKAFLCCVVWFAENVRNIRWIVQKVSDVVRLVQLELVVSPLIAEKELQML